MIVGKKIMMEQKFIKIKSVENMLNVDMFNKGEKMLVIKVIIVVNDVVNMV